MEKDVGEEGRESPETQSLPVDLSVIVPTRNEAKNIEPLLNRLSAALEEEDFEVIFVDDSTDQTPDIITRLASTATFPVKLINRPESRRNGLSGAVVEGIESARGRWFCVIDADLQHPPELIPKLLIQANRTGADVVVASRQADMLGPIGLSRPRALTSQILTILARMVFPRVLKNVSDPLTGFFLVRRASVNPDLLQPEGFKILLEILARHPDLRVSELHFEFAPRHEGQSKADLNEGMRFFRHLLRLRLTVNQHLIRFLIVIMLAVVINLVALILLVEAGGWSILLASALAGGISVIGLLIGEAWIFSERLHDSAIRRMIVVSISGLIFLGLLYLPVIWLLAVRLNISYAVASLAAMLVAGFFYYLLSEQWIWTRGLMMRPRESYHYDIHGLITIASQIELKDLGYFQIPEEAERIDLQVRVDRHGTPSRVPGAICYDEHLGRFGFGLTVMPGDFSEIVVSPLLETSPEFLYANVIEPVIHWLLLTKGFVLIKAAAVQFPAITHHQAGALLIAGEKDLSYGLSQICKTHHLDFMGDDRVIVGKDRVVLSFPKPVTINPEMKPVNNQTFTPAISLRFQRWLYSQPIRQAGLFLSRHDLPAATINTYLQRFIPQPKIQMNEVSPQIKYSDRAFPVYVATQSKGDEHSKALTRTEVIDYLIKIKVDTIGFQPYPLLIEQLNSWDDRDWTMVEREILHEGLADTINLQWQEGDEPWWVGIMRLLKISPHDAEPSPTHIFPTKPTD